MRSHRVIIAGAVAVVVLIVVALAAVASTRGDAIEANGDLIAFSCKEPKNTWYAICIARSDGTERRRISHLMRASTPAWSPNGQRIAFTRNEDVGEYTTFSEDDVFVMDADGDDVQQLTADRVGRHTGQPTWSPDGRQIAYIQGGSVPTDQPSRPGSLFVMDTNGNVRRLTRGDAEVDPAWAPDGTAIAYGHCFNIASPTQCTLDLFVLDVASGVSRQLTRTPFVYEAGYSWSPDSTRIAFTRWTPPAEFNPSARIYVINRDGTGEALLHEHQSYVGGLYSLAWSPDGRTLAFETSPNRECTAISLIDVSNSDIRSLTSCERQRESTRSPAWQPDPGTDER